MVIGIQLGLLMWKNFMYQRRRKNQLIGEVVFPLLMYLLILLMRKAKSPLEQHECHFPNKALPSAGTLSWIQGIVCNIKNPCLQSPTPGETPGLVRNFENSILFRVLVDTQKILLHVNKLPTDKTFSQLLSTLGLLNGKRTQRTAEDAEWRPDALLCCLKQVLRQPAVPVSAYLRQNETYYSRLLELNASLPPGLVEDLLGAELSPRVFSPADLFLKEIVCNASALTEFLAVKGAGAAEDLQKRLCALPPPTLQALEHSFISQADWVKIFAVRWQRDARKNRAARLRSFLLELSLRAMPASASPPPPPRAGDSATSDVPLSQKQTHKSVKNISKHAGTGHKSSKKSCHSGSEDLAPKAPRHSKATDSTPRKSYESHPTESHPTSHPHRASTSAPDAMDAATSTAQLLLLSELSAPSDVITDMPQLTPHSSTAVEVIPIQSRSPSVRSVVPVFASSVALRRHAWRRHAWLRSTNLQPDIKQKIEDLPFDGLGLFHASTDEVLTSVDDGRKRAKRLGVSQQNSQQFNRSKTWRPSFQKRQRSPKQSDYWRHDWLFIAPTQHQLQSNLNTALTLLKSLGLRVNASKSHLTPTQDLKFIGALLRTSLHRAFLPEDRALTIIALAKRGNDAFLHSWTGPLHYFFPPTPLLTRVLERLKSQSVDTTKAQELLYNVLRDTELLAEEVYNMTSFREFRMVLQSLSWAGAASSPVTTFMAMSQVMCGRPEGGDSKILSSKWYEDHNLRSFRGPKRLKQKLFSFDDMSPSCKDLMDSLLSNTFFRPIWIEMYPMFLGKILYAPSTPATQKVMAETNMASRIDLRSLKVATPPPPLPYDMVCSFHGVAVWFQCGSRVNRTFQNLAVLRDLRGAWQDLGPQIFDFMNAIQNLLESPGVAQYLEQRLSGKYWNVSSLREFLSGDSAGRAYTWRDAYAELDEAIRTFSQFLECALLDKIEAVSTEERLISRALLLEKSDQFWAGVVFLPSENQRQLGPDLPARIHIKIHMDIGETTNPLHAKGRVWQPGPTADPFEDFKYVLSGFVYVQDLVEQAVVRVLSGMPSLRRTGIYVQQMPYPCYANDPFLRSLANLLPLCLILAWNYSVSMLIKGVVHEKEARLKETMKIMGLRSATLWLSWFLSSLIFFLISILIFVTILKQGNILPHSDPVLVFVFLTCYAMATISQCFLISTFFSRANLAAACGGVVHFAFYLVYVFCKSWNVSFQVQLLISLLPHVAFGFGCQFLSFYEERGMGIQWENLYSSPMEGGSYTFATTMAIHLFSVLLCVLATLYIESVFPGEYGIPKPWYFPFQESSCFGRSPSNVSPQRSHTNPLDSTEALMEDPPDHLKVGVSIRNLVKIYPGTKKIVVNRLSLDFYEGQISAFLGQNGAGKTTTINILTGLVPPTSGTAYVLGKDIRSEMNTIRKTLGMCPQHNVLFDILTVEEHIWFYGRLKGLSGEEVKEEIDEIIEDVGLPHKREEETKNLSGGMQRKLSIAIAFVGGSKVVILDEPTAGVDPYSRRGIWELLMKYRAGRTIILSTHYMDEADLVSDRIAIISQGRLCCCGSSLFLKTKLGTGYYLTLVKQEARKDGDSSERSKQNSKSSACDVPLLTTLVQKMVPGSRLVEDVGQEVVYVLPYSGAKGGAFGNLFKELDSRLGELGISGYGISDTSLEEIFLKVAKNTDVDAEGNAQVDESSELELAPSPRHRQVYHHYSRSPSNEGFRRSRYHELDVASHRDCEVLTPRISDFESPRSKAYLSLITTMAEALNVSLSLDSPKISDVVHDLVQADFPAGSLLPMLPVHLEGLREAWDKPASIPTTSKRFDFLEKATLSRSRSLPSQHQPDIQWGDSDPRCRSTGVGDRSPRYVPVGDPLLPPGFPFSTGRFRMASCQIVASSIRVVEVQGYHAFGVMKSSCMCRVSPSLTTLLSVMCLTGDPGMSIGSEGSRSLGAFSAICYKVTRADKPSAADEPTETDFLRGVGAQDSTRLTGWALTSQQLLALFTKRFLHARRSIKGFFAQIVLPVVLVCLSLLTNKVIVNLGASPPLALTPSVYGPQKTFFRKVSCSQNFVVPEVSPSVANVFKNNNWTLRDPSPPCECSSEEDQKIFPDCPEAAGGLPPPQMQTETGFTLQNLSGRNISDYLVKTYSKIMQNELKNKTQITETWYGGFSVGAHTFQGLPTPDTVNTTVQKVRAFLSITKGSSLDRLFSSLSGFVDGLETSENVKVWFNNKGLHAMASFINVANNGLLRASLPAGADHSFYGIVTVNQPLNETQRQLFISTALSSFFSVLISTCVMFALSFVPASFVLFLIEERISNAKHLQIVNGMKPWVYWLGNFAWDVCNYLIPAALVVLIFICFQQKAYVSPESLPTLILLLLLYGWSMTPLMYPASYLYSIPSSAYVSLTTINFFIGFISTMVTVVLDIIPLKKVRDINSILKAVFLVLPQYCLGRGLTDMAMFQVKNVALGRSGGNMNSLLSWDLVGKNLFAMAVEGFVFFFFTILVQYRFFIRFRPSPIRQFPLGEEDEDVAKERKRILSGRHQDDTVVLQNLTKVTPLNNVPAVDRVCVGIPPGECFGLLGVNGAGKTTIFKMLTGDIGVTMGNAFLKGYSVLTHLQSVHENLGYCPQFDAISDFLTGREHLEFYCRLRGIPERAIPKVVQVGIHRLDLTQHADKLAGQYSGGNKRKLSTAIALIGAPPAIFLDEPTTGMDPRAKRSLWNCILSMIKGGRCVVLTSHSMEECEALCTRMAIMVSGRFQCLGSVQHLKNRFGEGYTIMLRVSGTKPDLRPLESFMQSSFPNIVLKEKQYSTLQYQLPSRDCSLAKIFGILSAHQGTYHIEEYSISQTTLDQVFVHFAKYQSEDAHSWKAPSAASPRNPGSHRQRNPV
ncbi:phospholipid-transporting ATPase ABCA1-like [Heteronotia binoei]|uniref:phospholipid-transporting ATPase ABCA1-like n=1 Tax=Heteronotia binoei TaxID=13085 RepID=UPI0029302D6C|nr:phospholipid-transporting ATPase ABCA1-like [Heteronotia binoei]